MTPFSQRIREILEKYFMLTKPVGMTDHEEALAAIEAAHQEARNEVYSDGYNTGLDDAHKCQKRHAEIDRLESELEALRVENERLKAQSRTDAIDGHSAMEEANLEIINLRSLCRELTRALKKIAVGGQDQQLSEIADEALEKIKGLE